VCASTVELTTGAAHVDGLRAPGVAMAAAGAHGSPACAPAVGCWAGTSSGRRTGREVRSQDAGSAGAAVPPARLSRPPAVPETGNRAVQGCVRYGWRSALGRNRSRDLGVQARARMQSQAATRPHLVPPAHRTTSRRTTSHRPPATGHRPPDRHRSAGPPAPARRPRRRTAEPPPRHWPAAVLDRRCVGPPLCWTAAVLDRRCVGPPLCWTARLLGRSLAELPACARRV
jgi:hypothetical protein